MIALMEWAAVALFTVYLAVQTGNDRIRRERFLLWRFRR